MLTIGQLARYAGVTVKTVRVYHAKGLLAEPARDASGYRRYTADDLVELIKIRTLAEAGVPLARIGALAGASPELFRQEVDRIHQDVSERIRTLRVTQTRLRELAAGRSPLLPADVSRHLARLGELGFSDRWTAMESDLWILVFATHPGTARALFTDQADALADPGLRQIYLDYDHAHDWNPDDPRLEALADRILIATRHRYGGGDLPGQLADSDVPSLVQGAVNASSPAWRRLDGLIRSVLHQAATRQPY